MGPVSEACFGEAMRRLKNTKPFIDRALTEIAEVRSASGVYSTLLDQELRDLRRELNKVHASLMFVWEDEKS